jgi:hypothetical protein
MKISMKLRTGFCEASTKVPDAGTVADVLSISLFDNPELHSGEPKSHCSDISWTGTAAFRCAGGPAGTHPATTIIAKPIAAYTYRRATAPRSESVSYPDIINPRRMVVLTKSNETSLAPTWPTPDRILNIELIHTEFRWELSRATGYFTLLVEGPPQIRDQIASITGRH